MDKILMDFIMTRKCQLFNEEKELRQKGDTHGADLCSHVLYELESITQDYEERASQKESNEDGALPIQHVSGMVCANCGNDFFVTTINGGKKCHKCGSPKKT